MNRTMIVIVCVAVLILMFIASNVKRRKNYGLNPDEFMDRWKDLQKYCAQRKTWPLAIVEADNLLADALKKRHYKGKTTGERLVAAQRSLTDNEGVWFGHKLRNRIVHEDVRKLRKQDVLEGLNGFRQALRDLGALEV